MHQAAVLAVVRIALGAEADDRRILLVRDDLHHAVSGDGVLIEHKGDDLARLNGERIDFFHIDQRACVIGRLHGAGEHGEHLQTHQPRADQQQRQDHHQHNQRGADRVPDFPEQHKTPDSSLRRKRAILLRFAFATLAIFASLFRLIPQISFCAYLSFYWRCVF